MPQPYAPRSRYPVPPTPGPPAPKPSLAVGPRSPGRERVGRVHPGPVVSGPSPSSAAPGIRASVAGPPSKPRALPPGPGPLDERGRRLEPKARPSRGLYGPTGGAKRTPVRADHSLGGKPPLSSSSVASSSSSSSSSSPPPRRRHSPTGNSRELQERLESLALSRPRRSPSLGRQPPAPAPLSLKRSSSLRGLHQEAEAGPGPRPSQPDSALPGTSHALGGAGTRPLPIRTGADRDHLPQEQRKHKNQENLMIGSGQIGLRNLGNTCFMNAVLQCLSNTQSLREFCIRKEYRVELNGYGKNRCEMMDAFANLISALWDTSSSGSVNPIQFLQTFQKFVPHFMGYSQQDAQEFLRFLMDWLHMEINRKARKGPNIMSVSGLRSSSENFERMRDDEKSIQMWKRYLERDDSKIVDLFVGQLNSTLHCTACGHNSTTFEVFCDLSLPIPKRMSTGGRVSLADCLDLFTAEEELDSENAPMCERCNQRKRSTKKLSIQRFPKILVLHLNRFAVSRYAIKKSTTYVVFPLYGLSLRRCSAEKAGSAVYNLYAVCNHTGTVSGGHYTAYCKSAGRWHVFNDARTLIVPMPRTLVVIGAGISGLAASYHLSRAANVPKVILFEASDRLGGWLQTTRTEEGAIFEHGPRGVRTAGIVGKNTLQLVSELGLESDLLPVCYSNVASKNRYLYVGGKLCILPSGFWSALRAQPPFTRPMVGTLFREVFVKRSQQDEESVHSFAARRFGTEIAENAIDSLCRGIFAGESRTLSVRSCFPVLYDAERKFGSVVIGMVAGGAAKDPRLTTCLIERARKEGWAQWSLKGGMQSLPEAMEGALRRRGVEIHCGSPVRSLRQTAQGGWEVQLDGATVDADHIVSSVPAHVLSRILPASCDGLREGLLEIETVSVAVVNLEFEGSVLPVTGFGHLVPSHESREILGVVYDSCNFPEQNRTGALTTRLTVMMGGAWFREAFGDPETVPHERLLQRATEAVRDHLGVRQKPLRSIVKVQKDCIPQYTLGHWERLGTISRLIDQHRLPLTLTGASYQGVSVNDCIYRARSAVEGLRD